MKNYTAKISLFVYTNQIFSVKVLLNFHYKTMSNLIIFVNIIH